MMQTPQPQPRLKPPPRPGHRTSRDLYCLLEKIRLSANTPVRLDLDRAEATWLQALIRKVVPDVGCHTLPDGDCVAGACPLHVQSMTFAMPKPPTNRLKVCDHLFFDLLGKMPSRWSQFWQRFLLGWTWERIGQ